MHILIATDQHPDSLGGAQVAIRAQRASLERLGHTVTVVAPALHRPGYETAAECLEAYIALPSLPITNDKEYGLSLPTRRTLRVLASALRDRPPVDLVHVQGDFWGALIGVRAARGLRKPLVITMHNNVDRGTRAVTPFAPGVFLALRLLRRLVLGAPRGGRVSPRARGAWRYLAELAAEAAAVIAPSQHFADQLLREGVAPEVLVVRGGVDDTLMAQTRSSRRSKRSRPQLVWLGRMSHEKRVLEFIDALALARPAADVQLFGGGLLLKQVRDRIVEAGLRDRVTVQGPVPHETALAAMRDADALVQTSLGFETQGLTPFEAAALGTPTVFSDPAIADDAGLRPSWVVPDESVDALARTIREAVSQLTVAPTGRLRVARAQARDFLQSEQTKRLIEIYERVLAR